ncbi:MAG: DUF2157 domain-containing protein [Betaproteobacteria bacterium]
MSDTREWLFDWNARGMLATRDLPRALTLVGANPGHDAWRRFLRVLATGAGTALLAVGVIFFIAFNWHDLPQMVKFGLVEAAIVVAIAACLMRGVDSIAGIAALCAAALLTGGLLALVGQVYQTGADTFELFALWALAILPWAVAGRQAPLWLIWLAIVNIAVQAWFLRWGMRAFARGDGVLWALFLVNAAALVAWEVLRASGVREFGGQWSLRIVAFASGIAATMLGFVALVFTGESRALGAIAWLAWLAAVWLAFRVRRVDVFVLAGALLSVVVIVAGFLGRNFFASGAFFAPLLVAAVIIALAGGGAVMLKRLAQEVR